MKVSTFAGAIVSGIGGLVLLSALVAMDEKDYLPVAATVAIGILVLAAGSAVYRNYPTSFVVVAILIGGAIVIAVTWGNLCEKTSRSRQEVAYWFFTALLVLALGWARLWARLTGKEGA